MQLQLLGTGSADGWPNPFCGCRSCAAARTEGVLRRPTAALVDGRLLLDCGPAALGGAADLTGVRNVLVTHAHEDHWHPQARFVLSQAGGSVEVVGPPAIRGDRTVRAGDRVTVGAYDVRVLAARHAGPEVGPAVLYDVAGPDRRRLLWATDTGPLPESTLAAAEGAAYDLVCLEETYGDGPAYAGDAHHGLADFAATVAALRERGAITAATRVVAVHLGHGNPPPGELAERLGAIGAQAGVDGQLFALGRLGRGVLVLGGARSGKSAYAESLLAGNRDVGYVATADERPDDEEWRRRVAEHRARRPPSWRTVETADVAPVLRRPPAATLLVDCMGLWLTRTIDALGGWDGDAAAAERLGAAVSELLAAWDETPAEVVAVSPEVGLGVVPPTPAGRLFRDELGRLNAALAATADEVWLVTAGIPRRLR